MVQVAQSRAQLLQDLLSLEKAAEALALAPVALALRAETERLNAARFVLALVGERLAGKSTVANALLGNPVLPARAVPTTALLHEVVWAERAEVTAIGLGTTRVLGLADLGQLTEGASDIDRQTRVRLGFPAEILKDGVTLLDTPGTNDLSTLGAELTYGILPDADAVVLVLDATQPLRRTEIDFLRHRLPRSARERTVAVLNKADLLGVTELQEARSYAEEKLHQVLPGAPLFAASAKLALERGDAGFEKLKAHLTDLLGKERARLALVRSAGEAARLGELLRAHLRQRREAGRLEAPDLEERLARAQAAAGGSRRAAHEACARVDARAQEIFAEAKERLADFTARFEAALPAEIDRAEEGDLRRYLPFFLEDTLRQFAEGEAARVETTMHALAYEALAELAAGSEQVGAALDLGDRAPVRVDVDTTRYDIGVFAAGAVGTLVLFQSPLLGLLILAGAPVLSYVLKGKVSGRVREVAKEQAVKALREARDRLEAKLRESVLGGAARIKEAVLAHGEEAVRGMELALSQALAQKRGEAAPALPPEIEASIEGACEDLARLAGELTQRA
jgi:ribosome biogenesis GTPase A